MLSGTELVIGRSPYCTLVLDHPSVSRIHASLRRIDDKIELRDLGSTNGTFVNGRRIETGPMMVSIGDEVRVGEQIITLEELSFRQFGHRTRENLPLGLESDSVTEVNDMHSKGLRRD